jgi:hypothetical protein
MVELNVNQDTGVTETKGVTVRVTDSAGVDGAVVVFIDTTFEPDASDGGPGLRVLINDEPAYEGRAFEARDDDDTASLP